MLDGDELVDRELQLGSRIRLGVEYLVQFIVAYLRRVTEVEVALFKLEAGRQLRLMIETQLVESVATPEHALLEAYDGSLDHGMVRLAERVIMLLHFCGLLYGVVLLLGSH